MAATFTETPAKVAVRDIIEDYVFAMHKKYGSVRFTTLIDDQIDQEKRLHNRIPNLETISMNWDAEQTRLMDIKMKQALNSKQYKKAKVVCGNISSHFTQLGEDISRGVVEAPTVPEFIWADYCNLVHSWDGFLDLVEEYGPHMMKGSHIAVTFKCGPRLLVPSEKNPNAKCSNFLDKKIGRFSIEVLQEIRKEHNLNPYAVGAVIAMKLRDKINDLFKNKWGSVKTIYYSSGSEKMVTIILRKNVRKPAKDFKLFH